MNQNAAHKQEFYDRRDARHRKHDEQSDSHGMLRQELVSIRNANRALNMRQNQRKEAYARRHKKEQDSERLVSRVAQAEAEAQEVDLNWGTGSAMAKASPKGRGARLGLLA